MDNFSIEKFTKVLFVSLIAFFIFSAPDSLFAQETKKKILIVPDKPTFLHYLSLWTEGDKYPIFIGHDEYVEKFASVYNQGNVEFVEKSAVDLEISEKSIYKSIITSLASDSSCEGTESELKDYFNKNKLLPKGIVLTNLSSKEWPAAAALALFHKQVLSFYTPPPKPLLGSYTFHVKEKIRKDIIDILNWWGFSYKDTTGDMDAITIALDMPYKYGDGYSLDDAINRLDAKDITCYAYTGRLMDLGKGLALYQAMCSIFLDTTSALLFDRWPVKWQRALEPGAWELSKHIPTVSIFRNLRHWWKATHKDNKYSLIFVNAAGTPDNWTGGRVRDIPKTVPVAVNFAHSTSVADLKDPDTIAGRWLVNGAFVYFGSVSEPYSAAFNLSQNIVKKWLQGVGLAEAIGQKESLSPAYSKPWKTIYIGDPLFYARFNVKEKDKFFYKTMKNSIEAIEQLQFGEAQTILETFLNKKKDETDETYYYKQAAKYLKKLYELALFEVFMGTKIYKYYTKDFIIALFSDYLHTKALMKKMYTKEKFLLELYERKYASLHGTIMSESYLDELWNSLLSESKMRFAYFKKSLVLGPVGSELIKQNVSAFLSSDGKPIFVDGNTFDWKLYRYDPLSNILNVSKKAKTDQVWFVLNKVVAESAMDVLLRFNGTCDAKIYLDKKHITSYSGGQIKSTITCPLTLFQGEHRLFIEVYPSEKNPGEISVSITDSDCLPVKNLIFD